MRVRDALAAVAVVVLVPPMIVIGIVGGTMRIAGLCATMLVKAHIAWGDAVVARLTGKAASK